MPNQRSRSSEATTVVLVGAAHGVVIAIPEEWAYEFAQLKKALDTSVTWADFRKSCPAHYWIEIRDAFRANGDRTPNGQNAFDRFAIPGAADGDWPVWPQQEMLEWVPPEILDAHGERKLSTLNGDFVEVPEAQLEEFVDALTRSGVRCIHNMEFIRWLCDDQSAYGAT